MVKTARPQGEVIGALPVRGDLAAAYPFGETVDAIRAQGGIVYLPHPFDRCTRSRSPQRCTAPPLAGGRAPRSTTRACCSRPTTTKRSVSHASTDLTMGAGSDAHVLQGVGTGAGARNAGLSTAPEGGSFVRCQLRSGMFCAARARCFYPAGRSSGRQQGQGTGCASAEGSLALCLWTGRRSSRRYPGKKDHRRRRMSSVTRSHALRARDRCRCSCSGHPLC